MKRMLVLLLLFTGSLLSGVSAQQKIEVYTYDVLPPFAYRNDQGELTGVYVEIVKEAVSKMPDYAVSFMVVPWSRAKHKTKDGKAFAILPPYFHAHDWLTDTKPRRPYIWPYSLALFTQHDVIVANKQVLTKPGATFPEDYAGLTVVMFRGDGRAGAKFRQMVADKKITLLEVNDIEACIKMLLAGRADCTITSRIPFAWHIKRMKDSGEYQKYDKGLKLKETAIISSNEGYLGYTDIDAEKNFPFKKDFIIKFDIEIYKMKKQGRINEIIKKFIDVKTISPK